MSKRPWLQHSATEEPHCAAHLAPLELFCEDDQVALCSQCLLSGEHKRHAVHSTLVAAEKYRKLFQELLKPLREKAEVAKSILADEQERMMMIQEEERNFKEMVASEYRVRLRLLREEKKLSVPRLQECKPDLNLREANWKQLMRSAAEQEEESRETLQNARHCLERTESLLLQPLVPARITDLSSCQIKRRSKMLTVHQRQITLDPETAHPCLAFSEDLRTVRLRNAQQDVPGRPGRFDFSASVQGAEGFSSGKHYWEVAVGKAARWQLGVCGDSTGNQDQVLGASPDKFLLMGAVMGAEYTFWVFPPLKKVCLQKEMQKVGVFVDYEFGHISFYNVTEGALIYNFSCLCFQGALRPLFALCIPNGDMNSDSLTLCPPCVPS
uniref:Tripartite motif family like 2 n=1 Tax=Chinchilla lanigera TaxID=34839 RepID=A0A8C2VQF9_CHILA